MLVKNEARYIWYSFCSWILRLFCCYVRKRKKAPEQIRCPFSITHNACCIFSDAQQLFKRANFIFNTCVNIEALGDFLAGMHDGGVVFSAKPVADFRKA